MNEFEKRKCLELTNKMLRKDLCRLFRERVDPERDGAPDYYTIIKNPMDLSTIRKKLNSNEYKNIEQWISDVNLIWKNAKLYNTEGSIIHFIAQELEEWFARKCLLIPRNKDEEWMLQLRKASTALVRLSSHPPSSIVPMLNLSLEEIIDDTMTLPFTAQNSTKTESIKTQTKTETTEQALSNEETNNDVEIIEPNENDQKADPPNEQENTFGENSDEKSGMEELIDL